MYDNKDLDKLYSQGYQDGLEEAKGMTVAVPLVCAAFGFIGYWLAAGVNSLIGFIF